MKTYKVTLRTSPCVGGRISYKLDIQPPIPNPNDPTKKTRWRYLKLYAKENPRTPFEKKERDENRRIAEQMRLNLQNELNKQNIYTELEKNALESIEGQSASFLVFFSGTNQSRSSRC